ncbi:MAG: hypothetical protein NC433_17690 [Clostridiales bacterium]|nr:hypothetical protein [Clostridiales bacterium]
MRKARSDEEKELKKLERENEKQERLKEVKKSLSNIPDDILIKFSQKLEKEYPDLENDDALNLLFKSFLNDKVKFTSKKIYDVL